MKQAHLTALAFYRILEAAATAATRRIATYSELITWLTHSILIEK